MLNTETKYPGKKKVKKKTLTTNKITIGQLAKLWADMLRIKESQKHCPPQPLGSSVNRKQEKTSMHLKNNVNQQEERNGTDILK